jgi:hypothetical protein
MRRQQWGSGGTDQTGAEFHRDDHRCADRQPVCDAAAHSNSNSNSNSNSDSDSDSEYRTDGFPFGLALHREQPESRRGRVACQHRRLRP